ncbi:MULTISPECIES: helix-turn-helix domain-containing protein [Enterococcus]|uniref:helix-turn-helix domain-containing protein n=1 Tax=Enterococcus TaxID=1350 RepID=UPI001157B99D|nr:MULTISPECIES: helix-turn-helix transcriptional regulator [Enterococcus]MDC0751199.1 helix-turn-helix transcriptional regulator [Enterococcus innesii]MDC0775286.1 helix-turn-helix transcriptional regulator [Enterococcus innesii]MDC0778570.1 helix-turn-helix transcriptional regulator [Enterococcus innesii]MDC0782046.1 helix-turn-helix transcriptional regulator [Enterococcus innesii]
MSIGENIKKIRKENGLTQAEFSKKIGISRTYLSDLENNRKSPSVETLDKMAEKLGVSTTYLINGDKYALLYNQDIEAIDFKRIKSLNKSLTSIVIKNKITSEEVPEIFDDNGKVLIDQQLYKLFKDYDFKQLKLLSSKLSFNSLENLSLYYTLCEKLNVENELSLFNEDELYFYLSRLRQDYYNFEKFIKNT